MDISIVIPAYNEFESLPELCAWIKKVCDEHKFSYEALIIDDGSTDSTWSVIREISSTNPNIRGIRFRRNYGKSAALNTAFAETRGDVVITMDADLQDSPDEIPELYSMIMNDGYDLVSGWKKKRYDPLSKTIPTKLFNWATKVMTGVDLHDNNCGLKSYRSEVVKSIEVYGEMHRYIPSMAKAAGFGNIGEKVVQHQARKYGVTKFGLERFLNGFLDLLSIVFVSKFGKRPMHIFGLAGTLSFIFGFVATAWIIGVKLYRQANGMDFRITTEMPLFYLALVAMIIGVQLFVAGFVAELVSRNSPSRNKYEIAERTGFDSELIA